MICTLLLPSPPVIPTSPLPVSCPPPPSSTLLLCSPNFPSLPSSSFHLFLSCYISNGRRKIEKKGGETRREKKVEEERAKGREEEGKQGEEKRRN
jgi:hypothetical protein